MSAILIQTCFCWNAKKCCQVIIWSILALIDGFGLSLHFQDILGEASSLLQSWKRWWDSPEDETIQYYFIGKAYFIGENCWRALKMNLYNTSLWGKPISKSETVWEPRRCNYTTLLNRLPFQLRWGRRRRHCSAIVWHTFFHALHLETRPPIFKMIKLKKLRHAVY